MLSDAHLMDALQRGGLEITPKPEASQIQPASIDLHLADEFAVHAHPRHTDAEAIDPAVEGGGVPVIKFNTMLYSLPPQGFALAHTKEVVKLAGNLAARVEGKSTLGRHGLMIHATAGFIDPGFQGSITLELFNCTKFPILLTPGMRICQLAVMRMDGVVKRPYGSSGLGSHYQGQEGATPAR